MNSSEMRAFQCPPAMRESVQHFLDVSGLCGGTTNENSDAVSKQAIPKLYRNTETATLALCGLGLVSMFADTIWSYTVLAPSVYIVWCLCCLSLFFTNKLALAEWKANDGQQRKAEQKEGRHI